MLRPCSISEWSTSTARTTAGWPCKPGRNWWIPTRIFPRSTSSNSRFKRLKTLSKSDRVTPELIQQLKTILGPSCVVADDTELLVYECDALTLFKNKPDVVVFPATTEHVAAIVRLAHKNRIPFLPRVAGTGLSGGATAITGGIIIELQRMNRVLSIDVENRIAVVQP